MSKIKKIPRCTFLGSDDKLNKAAAQTRTAINMYRNSESFNHWNTFYTHIPNTNPTDEEVEEWMRTNAGASPYDTRPAPEVVTDMTENIVKYLNRCMQHLSELTFNKLPMPSGSDKKDQEMFNAIHEIEPFRKEDVLLFSSKAFIEINNLDASLFKQTISTLYDKYDKDTDRVKMKIPSLENHLQKDFPRVHNALFNNGLGTAKRTLMDLRNTAGHSDLGMKIIYYGLGNPTVWVGQDQKDLYPLLSDLAHAYLNKAETVYTALSREVRDKTVGLD